MPSTRMPKRYHFSRCSFCALDALVPLSQLFTTPFALPPRSECFYSACRLAFPFTPQRGTSGLRANREVARSEVVTRRRTFAPSQKVYEVTCLRITFYGSCRSVRQYAEKQGWDFSSSKHALFLKHLLQTSKGHHISEKKMRNAYVF